VYHLHTIPSYFQTCDHGDVRDRPIASELIRRIIVNPRLPGSQYRLLRLAIMLLIALTQP
jgi:hypothetical protein